ncbi:2-hydroxyacid dehydrogenase [Parablautia intestinalis]|uniref:2-hydroxyacid dehydrogenase n=1 Tax=Parablautia intestinalis TaxID=2320100 RepID=A0A3A9ATP3_9FIRM|nr:2-hydroxyacid dehydrogenase [Parablautia intestinalis]MDE7047718.1 2-hydroxyacid dehydrogenase [Lachnospiraceae bacterium]RKI90941.1 2-hydroxyacid dehydrogenase [Parablautia intestinalis]
MKIAFYGTKPYDKIWFEPMGKEYGFDVHFIEAACSRETIFMAKGHDAICIFVNDYVDEEMINALYEMKVKAILLRSAGFNNVDVKAAEDKIVILRVPSYSPEAVAEFAMALLLTVNRLTHKAYNRTREFNMSLNGLMGTDLYEKTVGVIGTGKIGQAMIRILNGFQAHVLCYDPYPAEGLEAEYVSLEKLFKSADIISLHCPLTSDTRHLINKDTIAIMKKGVYLVNTSRGSLINTEDLIDAMLEGKFGGVGLDVYEEEEGVFYEDRSGDIITDDNLARLMTFPNVLVTSHMGFFTKEAMQAIAKTTLENAYALENGLPLVNQVGTEMVQL